ncbi:MAG: hypothetical protein ACF8GE_10490 [Phycisphaerales bacterium JB043]
MRSLLLFLSITFAHATHAQPSDFVNGDFYYTTTSWPGPGGTTITVIAHFDHTTLAHSVINSALDVKGRGSFDPFRGRLLVASWSIPLAKVDALGNASVLVDTGEIPVDLVSAGTDGRVYIWGGNKGYYIDSSDTQHQLMDATGSAQLTQFSVNAIFFDTDSNALFVADLLTTAGETTITRYALSPDGSQVVSSTSSSVDVSTTNEIAVGMNHGPGNTIYLQVDDNSNSLNPRMHLINKTTLAISTFASSGDRIVGGDIAGLYSNANGVSYVTESLNNNLHRYTLGSSGAGSIVASDISGGGSGETAQYMEVIDYTPCPTDLDNDGDTDGSDLGLFLGNWGNPGSTDLNNDGTTDGADLGLFLGNWGPCP